MASNPPGRCCIEGVKHEGPTSGTTIILQGKYTGYLATPSAAKAIPNTAVLYLPDAFGIWSNSKLMADQFAANGYLCLIVDIFNGDPVPVEVDASKFDFKSWISKGSTGDNPHTEGPVDEIIQAAIKTLKEEHSITKLGAVGYCFGGKYVARSYSMGVTAGFVAHPSFMSREELRSFKGPFSIVAAETDGIFPAELRHESEAILKESGQPYQVTLYSGVSHGFAVRGNLEQKIIKFAKEQAFLQAVEWFNWWL